MTPSGPKGRPKGAILIATIWIIMILSFLALGIGSRVSIEARLGKYGMERLKATALANAGIARCQNLLSLDSLGAAKGYDSLYECGITISPEDEANGGIAKLFTGVELGDGSFTVGYTDADGVKCAGMEDEERKINVNKADLDVLSSILGDAGVAAAIIDWRDPLANTEESYYASLENPYPCKNGDFAVLEELLLVKGMTPELFDAAKADITVYGDGKVNINTASPRVLAAIGLTQPAVDVITAHRNGVDQTPGTAEDEAFPDIDAVKSLLSDPSYSNDCAKITSSFTVSSNYFRMRAYGTMAASKVSRDVDAVLKRDDTWGGVLIHYHEY